jgi:hypothetical protein
MKGYVKLTPEGLIALNSDNATDQTMYNNDATAREFTSSEYTLFGDQLKHAGNENTKVTGTSLDDATVSFTPYTATELLNIALMGLRFKRNRLLEQTDYLALSDVTMSDAWKTYRQQLRDLTDGLTTESEVNSVTWPTKPS